MAGKVELPRFKKPTEPFLRLLFKDDFDGRTFRKFARPFNSSLCLSSLKCNERQFRGSNFKPTIVIEGRAHQFLGPLQAKEHETPRFAQVWVHDPAMETTQRLQNMSLPASATKAELEAVERIMKSLEVSCTIKPKIMQYSLWMTSGRAEAYQPLCQGLQTDNGD